MKTFATLLLWCIYLSSFSQGTNQSIQNQPYIEVTGMSEKEIVPDEIYVTIEIRERTDGRDQITIERQEANLKDSLKSIGVDLKNLSISDAMANYRRVKLIKKDVVQRKEYLLKLDNAKILGKVFQTLDKLKIEDAYVSKVSHSRIEDYKAEVRIMAIKAAKRKADYLLKAIDEETGRALKVYEVNGHQVLQNQISNIRYDSNAQYFYGSPGSSELKEEIQFQKIKLKASIYVKFEIKH